MAETGQPQQQLTWKQRAKQLKSEVYALYFAYRDPRVPWYAKAFIGVTVAYAFSPIDLIPDFIPVLGYLDDLILVPLMAAAAVRMIPAEVMAAAREQARGLDKKPVNWVAAAFMIAVWILAATWAIRLVLRLMGR